MPMGSTPPTGGCAAWSVRPTTVTPSSAAYHRLLVWDIEKAPRITRYADRLLNPLVGKSLVVYLVKPAGRPRHTGATASVDDVPGPASDRGPAGAEAAA